MNKELLNTIHNKVEEFKYKTLTQEDFNLFLIFRDYLDLLSKEIQININMWIGEIKKSFEDDLLLVNNCKMHVNAILGGE